MKINTMIFISALIISSNVAFAGWPEDELQPKFDIKNTADITADAPFPKWTRDSNNGRPFLLKLECEYKAVVLDSSANLLYVLFPDAIASNEMILSFSEGGRFTIKYSNKDEALYTWGKSKRTYASRLYRRCVK